MSENNRRFHTSCVLYCLVFYNSIVLTIPLAHLGDDHADRRIYVYFFRLRLSQYVHLYEFYDGLVVMVLELKILVCRQ